MSKWFLFYYLSGVVALHVTDENDVQWITDNPDLSFFPKNDSRFCEVSERIAKHVHHLQAHADGVEMELE